MNDFERAEAALEVEYATLGRLAMPVNVLERRALRYNNPTPVSGDTLRVYSRIALRKTSK